jgi:hypothetical protein
MSVIKGFLNSEKAIASLALIIGSTVLAALDKITPQQWLDYTQIILGIYVVGKTVQGAAAVMGKRNGPE